MRITRATLTPFRLRLGQPLATGHGTLRERAGFLLELAASDGSVGAGDAAPLPGFGLEARPVALSVRTRSSVPRPVTY